MTNKASELFNKLVDINWEMKIAEEEKDYAKLFELGHTYANIKGELINEMGMNEYNTFMENGRKLFASN